MDYNLLNKAAVYISDVYVSERALLLVVILLLALVALLLFGIARIIGAI